MDDTSTRECTGPQADGEGSKTSRKEAGGTGTDSDGSGKHNIEPWWRTTFLGLTVYTYRVDGAFWETCLGRPDEKEPEKMEWYCYPVYEGHWYLTAKTERQAHANHNKGRKEVWSNFKNNRNRSKAFEEWKEYGHAF